MEGHGDLLPRPLDPFSDLGVLVGGEPRGKEDGDGDDETWSEFGMSVKLGPRCSEIPFQQISS